jgi:hypothetical protein
LLTGDLLVALRIGACALVRHLVYLYWTASHAYFRIMRSMVVLSMMFFFVGLSAQPMDSIQVFQRIPSVVHTSAKANTLAWHLYRTNAPHRTLKGKDLVVVREAMGEYRAERHTYSELPDLTHVAMAFSQGRPLAFGVTEDLGRVINFTARKEYRISSLMEHLTVRNILGKLLVE